MTERYRMSIGGRQFEIRIDNGSSNSFRVTVDSKRFVVDWECLSSSNNRPLKMPSAVETRHASLAKPEAPAKAVASVRAPMPGFILAVHVEKGHYIPAGEPLVTMESMKMESMVVAPVDATVVGVHVATGQKVATGELLVELAHP